MTTEGYVNLADAIFIEQHYDPKHRPPREMLRTTPRRAHNVIKGHHKLWVNKKTTQFAWLPVKVEVMDQACSKWVLFEQYTINKLYMVTRAGPPLKIINTRN